MHNMMDGFGRWLVVCGIALAVVSFGVGGALVWWLK